MKTSGMIAWRSCFALAGALILIGGPQHPRGTMVEMLGDPMWVPSHGLMLVGFVALLVGLMLFRRGGDLPERTATWTRWAMIGTVLQVIEMAMHTVASVDHAHLAAGQATPVLTTHLWMAVVLYPIFGATMIGWILATARDRSLGSPWIAWLGIAGAVVHGLSAPLVVGLRIDGARVLFPMLMLLALWLVLAAAWPRRASVALGAEARA